MFSLLIYSAFLLALALVLCLLLRKKETPEQSREEGGLSISPKTALGDALPFHGIRVVDFSTIVAGPIAARTLADLGAEVIKVEGVSGDPFRKTFREYEPGRTSGTAFEMANLGKASVVVDLKTAAGKAHFFHLLKTADVLVTNVRVGALKRLGLDYPTLHEKLPHLVYCALTAYGSKGPDANAPGYDVGAFWAATGMAASIQPEPLHGVYPAAFGDITSGSALVGGCACALRRRVLNKGIGGLVDVSLLGSGLFCLSSVVCQAEPDSRPAVADLPSQCVLPERATCRHYACLDGAVAVLGPRLTHPPPRQHSEHTGPSLNNNKAAALTVADIERALFGGGTNGEETGGGNSNGGGQSLASAFASLPVADAVRKLKAEKVPCCAASELLQFANFAEEHKTGLFHPTVRGFEESVPLLARKPFLFLKPKPPPSSSASVTSQELSEQSEAPWLWSEAGQRPRACGPLLGAHTKDVQQSGWQGRHASCALPAPTAAAARAQREDGAMLPLEGVVVVELSWGVGVAASATAMLLRGAGATVFKIVTTADSSGKELEEEEGLLWARFSEQYDQGKELVELDTLFPIELASSPLLDLLMSRKADCFLTDAPPQVLQRAGVLDRTASAPTASWGLSSTGSCGGSSSQFVVAVVSPWGLEKEKAATGAATGVDEELPRGDLGPFWSKSGMGATLSGQLGLRGTSSVQPLPLFLGELITSVHAFAAVSSALLQRQRVASQVASASPWGVLVDVSMERSGLWGAGCIATWLAADPHKAQLWNLPPEHIPIRFPIPTMSAVVSKDGVSLQLLGLDFAKHLLPTLKALDACSPAVLAKLGWALLTEVLPSQAPSRILKLVPLLRVANGFILRGARSYTFAELETRFEKFGVWYTVVKSPAQAAAYVQAEAAGCFRHLNEEELDGGGGVVAGGSAMRLIASPVHFR